MSSRVVVLGLARPRWRIVAHPEVVPKRLLVDVVPPWSCVYRCSTPPFGLTRHFHLGNFAQGQKNGVVGFIRSSDIVSLAVLMRRYRCRYSRRRVDASDRVRCCSHSPAMSRFEMTLRVLSRPYRTDRLFVDVFGPGGKEPTAMSGQKPHQTDPASVVFPILSDRPARARIQGPGRRPTAGTSAPRWLAAL